MKNSILSIYILAVLTLFTSCDKFLSRNPLGQIAQDELFNSESNANAALMGMYRTMMSSFSYGQSMIIVPEFSAMHVRHASSYPEYETFVAHKVEPGNPWTENIWGATYATINATNQIIEEVPKMTESMISQSKKEIFVGEAKFVRALNYFFLVRAFGRLPLKLTYTTESSEYDIPQSETEEVYTQIIQDLTEAIEALPQENPYTGDAARGRASHWAAKALLAKVYLYQASFTNEYQKAAELSEEVIRSEVFGLVSDFSTIWTTQNTNEAIFELQFDDQATNPLATVSNGGSALFLAKDTVVLDLFEDRDIRGDFSIKKEVVNDTLERYYIGKLPNFSPASQNATLIRLAEIYLIHAEAKARIDNSVSDAAYQSLKAVQDRANITKPISDYTDLDSFIKAVQEEKERELLFEGEIWFDYCRTGLALEKYDSLTDADFFVYPIPEKQIALGTGLVQNPGY